MNVSDFVNALADNPESNIEHAVPECDHDYEVLLEVRDVEVWTAQRALDGTMMADLDYTEGTEAVAISSILCRDCGAEPDDAEWREIERAMSGG